jgi:oligogalacturonide lyase
LLFISNRSGSWQLYDISPFPDGPIRQLTDGHPVHPFSPAFHPRGECIFFVRGAALWSLDLLTLVERVIIDFGAGSMGEPSLDPTAEWVVAAIKRDGTAGLAVGRVSGEDWSIIPFPRTVIHPQFHPTDPDWIEFAADPAPRMHRVRRNGSAMECLYEHGNSEFVVHETFLGDTGGLLYTVWPKALRVMDWSTRKHRTLIEKNAWHITPNRAGTHVLYDTNHPDRGIRLFDIKTRTEMLVCLSEASNGGSQWRTSRYALAEDFVAARSGAQASGALSWMEAGIDTVYGPQWTHPHPSFCREEKRVVFASDRTGCTQVYVAEIPPI